MKQILAENFRYGLDTRRDVLTSQLGTLVTIENAHVNQGGEIEGRKAFVKLGQLPASSFGIEALPSTLVTFGSRAVTMRTSQRTRLVNVATLTFPARRPTTTSHDFLVGDSVTIIGLGGVGYNITSIITAITNTTITFASPGANEGATADVGGTVSVVLLNGFQYQRLRHWRYAIDQLMPDVTPHMNPNILFEPAMTGVTHSCCFGGKALAIAAFGPVVDPGNLDVYDSYLPWTGLFNNGTPVDSSFQGLLDVYSSSFSAGAATNYWLRDVLQYVSRHSLKDAGIVATAGLAADASLNFTGPINQTFSMFVDDTNGGQLTTALFAAATTDTVAVGAKVTIYLTKGTAGNISVLTAPNVVDGAVAGNVDLLGGLGNLAYDRSLYQTAIDLATRINSTDTGYSAQPSQVTSTVASVVITAPSNYGSIVNAQNLTITSTTIFISASPAAGSGAVAAATTYGFGGGVTSAVGTGQIQRAIFNVPMYPLGTYQCTLTFNGFDYELGRGNLTTRRASTVFFLISGGAGSVGPILLPDGTNLLNSTSVPFNTDLLTTCKDIVNSINAKYGGSGLYPFKFDVTSWAAYVTQVGTTYGVMIQAPTVQPTSFNGQNNIDITSATILVGASATDTGGTSTILSLDNASDVPTRLYTMGQKAYCVRGEVVNFSKINDGNRWESADTGAGFFQVRDIQASASNVLAVSAYQGKLAALARHNIQIWNIDANPANYSQFQNLQNIGTNWADSVQSLGELDLFFLADTGIRSLRARETSLNAFVSDIGSPIDSLIVASLKAGPNTNICSIVDPEANRLWECINGVIYVLSYFPSTKITAFSTYTPSYVVDGVTVTFVPEKMVVYNGQVYIRDTNRNIYVFGGLDNNTYDGSIVTIETPWLYNKTPYTPKQFKAFDAALAGKWTVYAGSDPEVGLTELVLSSGSPTLPNVVTDSTFDKGCIPYEAQGTHVKLKFVSTADNEGKVLLGSFALLYDDMESN